jgi:hypothetical protein
MITAAAPAFPRLRPSVTSVSVSTTRCLRDDSCELRLRSQDHDLQLPYLCWREGPVGNPYLYPECRSVEAGHTSSIPSSTHRRSPQRDVQNIGMAMNPHWLQGFSRRVGAENLCHHAIFVDDTTCAVVAPDPEMIQVGDAIWQGPQWRGLVQGAVRRCELQESSYSRSTVIRWRWFQIRGRSSSSRQYPPRSAAASCAGWPPG